MMSYMVDWVESKKDDWKIATLREITEGGLSFEDVSINKTDQKGRQFPGFDGIMAGATVHGNLWRNPKNGKYTLFAPDPKPSPAAAPARPGGVTSGGGGARGVAAAQERKKEGIREAQDNKGRGVLVSAAFRDATLILVNHPEFRNGMTPEEYKAMHKRLRDWYIAEYKATEKSLDVPF